MESTTSILLLSRDFRSHEGFIAMMEKWYATGEKAIPSSLKETCHSALRKQGIPDDRLTERAILEASVIAIRDDCAGRFQRAMRKLESDVKSEKAEDRITIRDAAIGQSSMFEFEEDDETGKHSAEILELFSSVAKYPHF